MNLFNLLQAPPVDLQDIPPGVRETSFSWLPPQMTTTAHIVDSPFWFVFWVCVFFFVLIVGLMMYFVIKYRRRDESEPPGEGATHNTPLEVAWTVIPLLLAVVMFYWGLDGYVALATPPSNCYEVNVTTQKWSWNFRYEGGAEHDELHTWVGQPVKLIMRSQDVLHCVDIPDFRVKMDIVPGRYTVAWFETTQDALGEHRLYCAEYCGQDHSSMKTKVVVHQTREEFEEWLVEATTYPGPADMPLHVWGKQLYLRKGCASCHNNETEDQDGKQGPSWVETAKLLTEGGMREFTDDTSAKVDENYINESIMLPKKRIAKGYEKGNMPGNTLNSIDRDAIIAYIKMLRP